MRKPRVFIGSSKKALGIARAVEHNLKNSCTTKIWDKGVFKLSHTTIEDLEAAILTHEFAVLVFTPDDVVISKNKKTTAPRDNVVFELGLFIGSIGRGRTFVVCDPKVAKIPSDLLSVKFAIFDWQKAKNPKKVQSALSSASTDVMCDPECATNKHKTAHIKR